MAINIVNDYQDGKKEKVMNKGELIDALREKTDITKSDAEMVVNTFFNEITSALERSDRVEIRGFCSFFVKKV